MDPVYMTAQAIPATPENSEAPVVPTRRRRSSTTRRNVVVQGRFSRHARARRGMRPISEIVPLVLAMYGITLDEEESTED